MQLFNSKRDRLQIFAEILEQCKQPQVKTHVMRETNLSYVTLQDCISQLKKWHLVEVTHHIRIRYRTTDKGLRFLNKWTELQLIINEKNCAGDGGSTQTPLLI